MEDEKICGTCGGILGEGNDGECKSYAEAATLGEFKGGL